MDQLNVAATLILLTTTTCLAQSPAARVKDQPPPGPPARGHAVFFADLAPLPPNIQDEMQYLCESSQLIIQAVVESISTRTMSRHLETDSVLHIEEVFKARPTVEQVIVAERGGVLGEYSETTPGYALMKPGERYILFLTDGQRSQLPATQRGTPRYTLTRGPHGKFLIDSERKVRLSRDTPNEFRQKYEGELVERLMVDIRYWAH